MTGAMALLTFTRPGTAFPAPALAARETFRPEKQLAIRRPQQLCSAAVNRTTLSEAQPVPERPIDSLQLVKESELATNGHQTASKLSAKPKSTAVADTLQHLKAEVNIAAAGVLPCPTAAAEALSQPGSPKKKHNKHGKQSKTQIQGDDNGAESVPSSAAAAATTAAGAATVDVGGVVDPPRVYTPEERKRIRESWKRLMRWSKRLRTQEAAAAKERRLEKVVIFGGGSFGTAMGVALARSHEDLHVILLLRDAYLCREINESHRNTRYLPDFELPPNVTATTSAVEAIAGAQYALHAVPVQHTRAFLQSIKDILPPNMPIISVSKGIELQTGQLMSEVIPSALGRKQPTAYLSGPSFASEVMASRPTGIVAASKDRNLARDVQKLFASPTMRVNTSHDVVGVEICGALKNVLAIAAGIVEGLDLGHNAMAALVAQGCAEIRWLAEKMGAKPETISGLSGLGDIMLTCYGSLSRNRSVGVRLGRGEALADILASSSQVAEGVATAGVVVSLARKYRVELPVLTAVAQVLNGHISAAEAVMEIMMLPQVEER